MGVIKKKKSNKTLIAIGVFRMMLEDNAQTLCEISPTWNGNLCNILWLMDSEVLFSSKITKSHDNKIHR